MARGTAGHILTMARPWDAIPQAWAVISGAADAARTQSTMDAVQQRLVRSGDKLIQLFDPPFDKGALQPGDIN